MKLSVSLPDADITFLDEYAERQGIESRSAVLQRAVRLLKSSALGPAYESAWEEWSNSGEADVWDVSSGDGLQS
jgi:Arc/MetJ-type ribon-helix-helix transcriptional regulator